MAGGKRNKQGLRRFYEIPLDSSSLDKVIRPARATTHTLLIVLQTSHNLMCVRHNYKINHEVQSTHHSSCASWDYGGLRIRSSAAVEAFFIGSQQLFHREVVSIRRGDHNFRSITIILLFCRSSD